jgi:hypothetical protein
MILSSSLRVLSASRMRFNQSLKRQKRDSMSYTVRNKRVTLNLEPTRNKLTKYQWIMKEWKRLFTVLTKRRMKIISKFRNWDRNKQSTQYCLRIGQMLLKKWSFWLNQLQIRPDNIWIHFCNKSAHQSFYQR